jgi:hypothetical protein
MKPRLIRLALVAVAGALMLAPVASAHRRHRRHDRLGAGATQAGADVLSWYDITNQTINAAAYPEPVTGSRAWDVSWLAAARAVRGHRDRDYAAAAFAQALHDALAALVPSQQAALDADLSTTLATIPDSPGKTAGITAGRREAATALAERQGDGLDTTAVDSPFTPPVAGPGVWQPTPPTFLPAVRAGQGNARSFRLAANDQFDPGPPPSLTSRKYLRSLAETRALGAVNSAVRTDSQTDTAKFWEPAANIQYIEIVRGILADSHHSLAWDARFVAAFQVVTTDAQIAIYNAKFKYAFWRPVTAIREGSVDPDPSWTPFFTTPRHPEYPSGHGGYAGAAERVLDAFVGRDALAPIAVTSPTDPGSTHTYSDWREVTREVIDARVWEGIHFRFSDVTGARVGAAVAEYDLRRLHQLGL